MIKFDILYINQICHPDLNRHDVKYQIFEIKKNKDDNIHKGEVEQIVKKRISIKEE